MSTPHDPDLLLALALARVRDRYLRPVRTHEEILAAARDARVRALRARLELEQTRARCGALVVETLRTRKRLGLAGSRSPAPSSRSR